MADIRTTAQLTDFTGANEDPLSDGGRWASAGVAAGGQLARKSNAAVNSIIGGATLGHSIWTPSTFSDSEDIEVWGQASGGGGGAAGDGWRLGFFNAAGQGYTALYFNAASPFVLIRKYFGGLPQNIAGPAGVLFNAGTFLFRKSGTTLSFYNSQDFGANWSLLLSVDNGEITGDFNLVLGAEDQGGGQIDSWISFGGGNPITEKRQQIYRVLRVPEPASMRT